MRNIVVVEYESKWPETFASEAHHITNALAPTLIEIHHIGSTSVPGLAAKPTIDMLAVVRNLNELDAHNDAMIELGYEPKGEFGIAGRRFFSKGADDCRTHHVHAYESGHLEIRAYLEFRDYLRAHPGEAVRYAELKAELAVQFRNDIEAYVAGKTSLIKEILDRARQWHSAHVNRI